MKSLWNDAEAAELVQRHGPLHGEALALRVYTSRLIGRDPDLVLHGGGNTSVKTTVRDIFGAELAVIRVKGSGADLQSIEPAGLPALELAPLLLLRRLDRLSDEDMVNQLRIRLLDAAAPTPSVETLLHAFLPHRFIDHTHADAILVLTNQPDGAAMVREALGGDVVVLPWIMPGFPLAKAVAEAYEANPRCAGVVLLQHGLFTFGDDARGSYERTIELVDLAEAFIARRTSRKLTALSAPAAFDVELARALAQEVMPVVRGALAGSAQRVIGEWRGGEEILRFTMHPDCRHLLEKGPLTPDHVIRTKSRYLLLARDEALDPERCRSAVQQYARRYREYFDAHRERVARPPAMLDPYPCVVLVKGAGCLAFGSDKKAAVVAADIAEHTLRGKALAQAVGEYADLPEGALFEMEYWSLEQAKLGKKKAPLLAGQVALISGGAGAIGRGIARALLGAGAHVLLTDLEHQALEDARQSLVHEHPATMLATCIMDVTDGEQVRRAFDACCLAFGGIDIVVPNAGVAHASEIRSMDPERFRHVVAVNLEGTMRMLKEAARVFELQGTGGSVVIQASKNVFDPGAGFGAYSASKAGVHQLGKVAALELAPLGVRVNMVNADAVFGDEVPSGLWAEVGPERMRARGLDPQGLREYYRQRNLLKVEVKPAHVGQAVVFLASGATPTTGATLPVDGGIPGAFPR